MFKLIKLVLLVAVCFYGYKTYAYDDYGQEESYANADSIQHHEDGDTHYADDMEVDELMEVEVDEDGNEYPIEPDQEAILDEGELVDSINSLENELEYEQTLTDMDMEK